MIASGDAQTKKEGERKDKKKSVLNLLLPRRFIDARFVG